MDLAQSLARQQAKNSKIPQWPVTTCFEVENSLYRPCVVVKNVTQSNPSARFGEPNDVTVCADVSLRSLLGTQVYPLGCFTLSGCTYLSTLATHDCSLCVIASQC
jgi:hypothetical protein